MHLRLLLLMVLLRLPVEAEVVVVLEVHLWRKARTLPVPNLGTAAASHYTQVATLRMAIGTERLAPVSASTSGSERIAKTCTALIGMRSLAMPIAPHTVCAYRAIAFAPPAGALQPAQLQQMSARTPFVRLIVVHMACAKITCVSVKKVGRGQHAASRSALMTAQGMALAHS